MRYLVPIFILKQLKAKACSGKMQAIVVNIDLIGFTALTQSIMQHTHAGVEHLIDTINAIFTPAISALESRGGFVAGFAGDAFTAVFYEENWVEALEAAIEIKNYAAKQESKKAEFGEFKLAVRIGIGKGDISWEIVPNQSQSVYWFCGSGIENAVKAQALAKPNEVIACNPTQLVQEINLCSMESIDGTYCRITSLKISAPLAKADPAQLAQDAFIPEALTRFQAEGEFRDVLSCFVNLKTEVHALQRSLIDSAIAYGGYISHVDCSDKGWVMYIIFGAPKRYEQNQLRAMNFALEQLGRCGTNIRIGLSEGMAYAGFIGSSTRGEYTGMGKAVNLAARFMMQAPWGQVWFDKILQKEVGDLFVYESLGLNTYRGYPQPVETFRLLDKQRASGCVSFRNRFIGRYSELRQLTESCNRIFEGRFAGVTYVYGTAGQGKSRMLFELKQRLENDVKLITLQTDSIHRKVLNPFSSWIRDEFTKGITGTHKQRTEEFKKNWSALLKALAHKPDIEEVTNELNRIESIVAGLIGLEWEDSVYALLEPKDKPVATKLAIKSLIETLCLLKPVVLVLEDLHWLDSESGELLTFLCRKATDIPMKLIITSRMQDDGSKPMIEFDNDVDFDYIDIDGLSLSSVRSLMQDVLSEPAGEELLSYVHSSSLGNPFIVTQLTQYLLETKRLEISNNTFILKESTIEMPESVQAILIARIDRLEAELKRMVHTASVLGCEFVEVILSAMLNNPQSKKEIMSAEALKGKLHLGELEHIWNAVSEIGYIFSHSMLRDAAYGMQLMKQLKHLHLLAAEAIKECYTEDRASFWQIAYHYEKSGDAFAAAQYHQKAGDYDKELFHFSAAMDHYVSAKNLVQSIRGDKHPDYALCLSRIGMVHWSKSEYDQALPYFEQALSIQELAFGKDACECLDNLQCIGSYHFVKGNYEQALSCFNKAKVIQNSISGEIHPNIATYTNSIANIYRNYNDFGRSLENYNKALGIRQQLWGDKHPKIATIYNDMADMFWRKGDYNQALVNYEKALAIRQETLGEEHPETAHCLNGIGDIYSQMGLIDKALNSYQKALAIEVQNLGNRHTATAGTLNNLGIVYDITGEFDKAIKHFEEALQIKQEIFGDLHFEVASVLNNLGGVYDHQGKYDLALQQHEKALHIWKVVLGERFSETASCLNNIGCAYENKGEYNKALGFYEQALEIYLEVIGENHFETSIALVNIGCIHEHNKDYKSALSCYNRALSIRSAVLGDNHPATQRTKNKIASLREICSLDQ